jgi:hypothetical protein
MITAINLGLPVEWEFLLAALISVKYRLALPHEISCAKAETW